MFLYLNKSGQKNDLFSNLHKFYLNTFYYDTEHCHCFNKKGDIHQMSIFIYLFKHKELFSHSFHSFISNTF